MKYTIPFIALLTILLSGCSLQHSEFSKILDKAEFLIKTDPDSASLILKNISDPENLDDKTFARWCMLNGKVTDKTLETILPTYHLERAKEWYATNSKPEEQVQILIYLGRSYFAEGDYDMAMSIYTNALTIAEEFEVNNLIGYIYSYMGDLYREKSINSEAIKKYISAAEYFKKENNTDSYACALRDLGREYACSDSLSRALEILILADSVAKNTEIIDVTTSINNALGNIYAMLNEYDKAEEFFLNSLTGREIMPSYMALTDLYINSDSINKAKELLAKISHDDPKFAFSFKYLYYRIYKEEKNYKEALANMEEYVDLTDSILQADSQSKILEIESKYNHLKISQELNRLKIKQQSYLIISVMSIAALLLIFIGYLLYRKKSKEKIQKQRDELNKMKTEMLYISLDLEKKKRLLETSNEKNEHYDKMQEEISYLTNNYRVLQSKSLENSSIIKELRHMANQSKNTGNKPLISDKHWKLIKEEITHIYPNLHKYLTSLCPTLPEQDFHYCCLYMCGFDTNTEAKLLYISTDSVRKKRLRLRQKLNITLPSNNSTLYEYLVENMP